jgi:hypothetical protein
MRIFGREPAVVLGIISATLSLAVTFNVGLSSEQAGAIVAVISGVFAAITAAITRPVTPSAFTGLVAVVVAFLATFHFNVAPETVGSLNALVVALLVFLTRGQVSPPARPRPLRSPRSRPPSDRSRTCRMSRRWVKSSDASTSDSPMSATTSSSSAAAWTRKSTKSCTTYGTKHSPAVSGTLETLREKDTEKLIATRRWLIGAVIVPLVGILLPVIILLTRGN